MKKYLLSAVIFFLLINIAAAQVDTSQVAEFSKFGKEVKQLRSENDKLNAAVDSLRLVVQNYSIKLDSLRILTIENIKEIDGTIEEIIELRKEVQELRNVISTIEKLQQLQVQQADSLGKTVTKNTDIIEDGIQELSSKIEETGSTANQKISALDAALNQNTLYWIGAFFLVLFLSGISYQALRKRIKTDNSKLGRQITDTKKALEEEGLRLDNKLIEVLKTQLALMKEERPTGGSDDPDEMDHSLALKVADEISRIQMNLNHMDPSTRGLKQLGRAVNSIVDNFQANGYEIPDLLNKPYDSGMNVVATMEPDKSLEKDQQIIKRIIKPQVNYNGVMIQAAQVVVAYGE